MRLELTFDLNGEALALDQIAPARAGEFDDFVNGLVDVNGGQFAGVLVAAIEFPHAGDDVLDISGGLADRVQLALMLLRQVRKGHEQQFGVGGDGAHGVIDVVNDAAGHLAQSAQALLLHDGLLGAAEFVVGLLSAFGRAHPVVKALAFLLGGEDLDLEGLLLAADGGDFGAGLFGVLAGLLQHENDHTDGDEELENRGDEETGGVEFGIFLRQRVSGQIDAPEDEAGGEQAGANKCLLLEVAPEAKAGKEAAEAEQDENRQLEFKGSGAHLGADQAPDGQEHHEPAEGSLPDREVQKAEAAPQEKDRGNRYAALLEERTQAQRGSVRAHPQAEGEPEGVKEPRGGPDGEVLAAGVAVEVEEKPDQNPDAQQGNHQGRP